MRRAALTLLFLLGLPATLAAQRAAQPAPRPQPPQPGVETETRRPPEMTASAFCEVLVTQLTQAETTLRQMAITLNAAITRENPALSLARASWMDHWVGRMSALIEATTPANCFDEDRLDRLRVTAAQYNAFAAQARDFALRPTPTPPPVPAAVERRREQRRQQQQEQAFQQQLLP
ncbi:MAG TPA: hypothetical protein VD970_18840 [Acetobacteraceae bacterium]|nr:hypothetical protein [Acetobacteraceae bacterium]